TSTAWARASPPRYWSACARGTASGSSPRASLWRWHVTVRASTREPAGLRKPRNGTILQRPSRLAGSHVLLARFGPFLGKRFTRNNLGLLGLAHAAFIGLPPSAPAPPGPRAT